MFKKHHGQHAVQRQPCKNGANRNDVTSCEEEREKDLAWIIQRTAERSWPALPADR